MPHARAPGAREPAPPPLPPESRTIGQLVAEAIRLYGRRFGAALPLGLPLAVMNQVYLARADPTAVARETGSVVGPDLLFLIGLYALAAPALSLAFAWAAVLAAGKRPPPPAAWTVAVAAGTIAFLPAALLLGTAYFLAVAWLALVGLVVPVVLLERPPLPAAFRRAVELGRADYLHAFGSLAALALVYWLTRNVLVILLRDQADNAIRTAVLLADLVLSPLVFLGAALLYADQAARVRSRPRRRRRDDAELPDADDAHRAGREDAPVEPGSPA
jgi:hypothetical protein